MKAEKRKQIETNSLAKWLNKVWTGGGARRSMYFYGTIIAFILLVILGWNWISKSRARDRADRWIALETTDSARLGELAEKYRGTPIGTAAKVRQARLALGPDGLDALGTNDADARKKAIENIKKARDYYLEAAPDLKDDQVMQIEAWMGAAQAEEALLGVPKSEGSSDYLGSLDKVIEYLQKARDRAGDAEVGKALAKQIEDYSSKEGRERLTKFYTDVNRQLATPKISFPSPSPGGLGPLEPLKTP